MAADCIPGADGGFDAWQKNLASYAVVNLIGLALEQDNIVPIVTARGDT